MNRRNQLLLLGVLVLMMTTMHATCKPAELGQPKPGCSGTCGNLSIPYPFGTTLGCCLDESFLIDCNNTITITNTNGSLTTSESQVPKAFLPRSDVPILSVSLENHQLRVSSRIARDCYYYPAEQVQYKLSNYKPPLSKFPISSERNRFITVGCYTIGYIASALEPIEGEMEGPMLGACGSFCTRIEKVQNGTCNTVGCCTTTVPKNVYNYSTSVDIYFHNRSMVNNFSPCGYSFVVEDSAFNFSSSNLESLQSVDALPLVLDWAVGDQTCEQAKSNSTSYACLAEHSECHNSTNGPGYQCKCSKGYQGNPYLLHGCQDINECEVSNPCISPERCVNLPGGFNCSCPKQNKGDGMRNGTGCLKEKSGNQSLRRTNVALGVCVGILVLITGGFWIFWGRKKRNLIKLKEKFFQHNGGLLLLQKLSDHKGSMELIKIFTTEELEKATNNYDDTEVVGQGGNGTVYKGVLHDDKVVAIKKSKICDESQIAQFINEVILLSQINHRNVVKLLGCCLETEVPLLVYEFITNGTLASHIHINKCNPLTSSLRLSWEMRLKVATETAGALAYLHLETCMPIIHRDVKTANILLDDVYTARVADFGASRLIPIDQTPLATLVQGTLGYLDPEYFASSQLTEKSDVYSFGVVLVELLTGKEAVFSNNQPDSKRINLAKYFVAFMEDNRLLEILDDQLVLGIGEEIFEQLEEVADLAMMCLKEKGEERPNMKEVTTKLEELLKNI